VVARAVTLQALLNRTKAAAAVLENGGEAPRLELDQASAQVLGVTSEAAEHFNHLPLRDQVRALLHALHNHDAEQRAQRRQATACVLAERAESLQYSAHRAASGLSLSAKALADLVCLPAFDALKLTHGELTWSFPRTRLHRILAPLKRCQGVRATLENECLVVEYINEGGHHGRFLLRDQRKPVGTSGVLTVSLPVALSVATAAEQQRPRQASHLARPRAPRPWFEDVFYAVAEFFVAS